MKYKSFRVQKGNDDTYRILATTSDEDRDGEIVEPRGITNLNEYLNKNPVVLFGHNYNQPPVGKATGGRVTDNAVELDIQFAETELGREIKYLYDEGYMNSFSIGFIPQETEPGGRFTKWELLEVSAVPVPANSAANMLRTVKEYGVQLPEVESLYRKSSRGAEEAKSGEESTKKDNGYWHEYIQRIRSRYYG